MTEIIGIIRAVLLVQPALAEAVKIPTCVNVCQKPVILFFGIKHLKQYDVIGCRVIQQCFKIHMINCTLKSQCWLV